MRCSVPDCHREATRRWGRPLCDIHHYVRRQVGSPWAPSIPAQALLKHRAASYRLLNRLDPDRLEENGPDPFLAKAFRVIKGRLRTARALPLGSTPGKPPERQAEAFWARLRDTPTDTGRPASTSPHILIADTLAILRLRASGEIAELRSRDYLEAQVGRRAHRRASNSEIRETWVQRKENGVWVDRCSRKVVRVQTKGRALRTIGRELISAVESVAPNH